MAAGFRADDLGQELPGRSFCSYLVVGGWLWRTGVFFGALFILFILNYLTYWIYGDDRGIQKLAALLSRCVVLLHVLFAALVSES